MHVNASARSKGRLDLLQVSNPLENWLSSSVTLMPRPTDSKTPRSTAMTLRLSAVAVKMARWKPPVCAPSRPLTKFS